MNKPKIVRPEESQPAHALWFDRKKYVTINFHVQKPKDVQDSRERVHDRTINVLLRKVKPDFAWPRLQKDLAKASWISVDFDNWRDWEHEEDDGKEEYDRYMDMIQDMATGNKGETPDMGDLSDVSNSFPLYYIHMLKSNVCFSQR
ncbi:hypothetical protein INR49_013795 [Caranx melampygus]|nr:hypothetical protein INR49_013795 [Caranx melampygus]